MLNARAQARGISAEEYASQVPDRDPEEVSISTATVDPPDSRPIWEVITEIMQDVPDEFAIGCLKTGRAKPIIISTAFPREISEAGF